MAIKPYKKAVGAIRFAFATVVMAVVACHQQTSPATKISKRFEVCVTDLPVSALEIREAIDFDVGTLIIEDYKINFYVGRHPQIADALKRKAVGINDPFEFLGKERSNSEDKVVWGHEGHDGFGPVYVMFSSPSLKKVESFLTKKAIVVECRLN